MRELNNSRNVCESFEHNGNSVKIFSYCYRNIQATEVPLYQKLVFDLHGIKLNQFCGDVRHSEFMDHVMRTEDCDIYVFFDIDCIPVKSDIITNSINEMGNKICIKGIEQQCNCNSSINHIYAGPACFIISRDTYNAIGCPSFVETHRSDVGEELTHICESNGVEVLFFKKTYSVNNLWKLGENGWFGHGTEYDNGALYHQFEIGKTSTEFINKCKSILTVL